MPGDVNALNFGQCFDALAQMFNSNNFRSCNPHLNLHEIQGLHQNPIQWPEKPVFSPYAPTHGPYSQVRFQNVKYLVHRVSLRLFLGQELRAGLDCSHVLFLGDNTGRNVNPRWIVQESNIMNQTRKACMLFMERWDWLWELGALGSPAWSDQDSHDACHRAMGCFCSFIHSPVCSGWRPSWGSSEFLYNGTLP